MLKEGSTIGNLKKGGVKEQKTNANLIIEHNMNVWQILGRASAAMRFVYPPRESSGPLSDGLGSLSDGLVPCTITRRVQGPRGEQPQGPRGPPNDISLTFLGGCCAKRCEPYDKPVSSSNTETSPMIGTSIIKFPPPWHSKPKLHFVYGQCMLDY